MEKSTKKLTIIYLAAGLSSRFGENKLIARFEGKPLFLILLEKLCRLCGKRSFSTLNSISRIEFKFETEIIVVTRSHEIMDICCELPVKVVYSPDSVNGISYSIKSGINAASEPDYYAFFVADQPFLELRTAVFPLRRPEQR